MTTITLNKDGTGRKDVDIKSIKIPDLWHVAEFIDLLAIKRENDPAYVGSHVGVLKEQAAAIREVWTLAHDMKRHIEGW